MQSIKKLVFIAIGVIAFSANSFGQATAAATATATIVTPIAISKTVDMNFGNVAVIASGTVVLAPGSTRSATGGVTLPNVTGTVAAASFNVTGQGNYTYSITLPSSAYTITDLASNTMTVTNFVSNPTVGSGGTLSSGAQTLTVGATLNVGAAQVAGTYTNSTGFNVTVNYN